MDNSYDITKRKNSILNRIKSFEKPKLKEFKCEVPICEMAYYDLNNLELKKKKRTSKRCCGTEIN